MIDDHIVSRKRPDVEHLKFSWGVSVAQLEEA